jgi:hypothetical protein
VAEHLDDFGLNGRAEFGVLGRFHPPVEGQRGAQGLALGVLQINGPGPFGARPLRGIRAAEHKNHGDADGHADDHQRCPARDKSLEIQDWTPQYQ